MGTRAALASGAALSVAVTAGWSFTATLTIGTPAVLHLTRHPLADYAAIAAAPTGSGTGLFAVTAAAFTLCLLVSVLRARKRALRKLGRAARAAGSWSR